MLKNFVTKKVVVAVFAIAGIALASALWSSSSAQKDERSAQMAETIRNARLTMADADGSRLPQAPDPALADATVEGIDTNANGIRDEVELALFEKYPGSENLKIRAASLQYAKALQMYLTSVFSKETLAAAAWQSDRGYICISDAFPNKPKPKAPDSEWRVYDAITKAARNLVKSQVLNTTSRQEKYEDVFERYMASHAGANGDFCDLQIP